MVATAVAWRDPEPLPVAIPPGPREGLRRLTQDAGRGGGEGAGQGRSWRLEGVPGEGPPRRGDHLLCIALPDAARHALWGSEAPEPGSLLLTRPGPVGELGLGEAPGLLGILVPAAALAVAGLPPVDGPVQAGEGDPWLASVGARLLRSGTRGGPCAVEGGHLVLAALAHLARALAPRLARPAQGGLAPWQARRVLDHVEASLDQELTLAVLAALCRLSPFHFARAFHETVGCPPHAYVTARRVDRARRLLEETDQPVSDIAASVGYAEPSHLARLFKRVHGVAPAAYRRRF